LGPQNIIVVTVEFADAKHTQPRSYYEDLFFNKIDRYFRETSYNQCWIVGDITNKWYQMPKSSKEYVLGRGPGFNLYAVWPFVEEAVLIADNDVDYSKYRMVVIVHAAEGIGIGYSFVSPVKTRRGTFLLSYVILPEQRILQYPGVPPHEFGHGLGGLPDMYVLTPAGTADTVFVGQWDQMSAAFSMWRHFSAWCKIKMGWIQSHGMVETRRGQTANVTLDPLSVAGSGVYALKIILTEKMYYLVEVRQKIGYDRNLPDSGVVIYLVDESKGRRADESPLIVQDATPDTATLDDSAYDLRERRPAGFFDRGYDVSVVIVRRRAPTWMSYMLFTGPVARGEAVLQENKKALPTMKILQEADAAIQRAIVEERTSGIDKAKLFLGNASAAYNRGAYDDAATLANQARNAAEAAFKPVVSTVTVPLTQTTAVPTVQPSYASYAIAGATAAAFLIIGLVIAKRRKKTS